MESQILQGLNPAQRAAVENYDVASLIIAGAGSGKTRVLTSRIAYMIEQGVDTFIEVGPGKTLSGFVKKIDRSFATYSVEDIDSLNALLEALGK